MKNIVLILFIFIAISCGEDDCNVITVFDVIEKEKKVDINELDNIYIEARNRINCNYVSYHYTIAYKGTRYKLPNFKYIKKDRYKNFSIVKYLEATNISLDSLKKKSNNIFKIFETLKVVKIWHVDNATIFVIDNNNRLLYCTDISLIENKHWKEFISKAKNKDNWYWLENQ